MEYLDIYKKYYNDELYVIGALDYFGVPHTPDNILLKSYIDMVVDELNSNQINVNYVNMHSLGFNKTWHLEKLLDKDYTKQEYYDLNLTQTKKVIAKKNVFPYPLNPDFLKHYYLNPKDPNLKITSHFSNAKNPIFFYSCGQMNFHKYVNMQTNDIKQIVPEILLNFSKNFNKTMKDIKNMVDYLIKINPSVQIYMFGVYPMFESKLVRLSLFPIYAAVNKKVKNYFCSYKNIYFVDIINNINYVAKDDCHPNFKGQCYMKKKVLSKIKDIEEKKI